MSCITSPFAEGGLVLYVFFVRNLYLIGLVPSMSCSFSFTFSLLIEINSVKHCGSSLEAVAFMKMLA